MFAHEMSHVRRNDALVNLFQLLVEALLFFNPFHGGVSFLRSRRL